MVAVREGGAGRERRPVSSRDRDFLRRVVGCTLRRAVAVTVLDSAADGGRSDPVAGLIVVVPRQAKREGVVDVVAERRESRPVALIVRAVLHVRVVTRALTGDPNRRVIAERRIQCAAHSHGVPLAVFGGRLAGEHAEHGASWQNVDRSARGIPAVQRSLRSLQDLYSFKIVKQSTCCCRPCDIDAVEVEGDGGILERITGKVANAAHVTDGGTALERTDLESGREIDEISGRVTPASPISCGDNTLIDTAARWTSSTCFCAVTTTGANSAALVVSRAPRIHANERALRSPSQASLTRRNRSTSDSSRHT